MAFARFEIDETDFTDEHALWIGKLALTWNSLHIVIFAYFVGFTGMPKAVAAAVFYKLKADTAQRDITLAAGCTVLEAIGSAEAILLRTRLRAAFSELSKFAGTRNGAIHGALAIDRFGNVAFDPYKPAQPQSPRFGLFGSLKAEDQRLTIIGTTLANVFNYTAEFLEWPEGLLK